MPTRATGRYEASSAGGEQVRSFVPVKRHPIVSAPWAVEALDTTKPTAGRAIRALVNAGVLVEITGKKRGRSYAYQAYLDRLRTGTELAG